MAFLCPARKQRKRSKVKIRGGKPLDAPLMGRITGSDSIDTLVRVGIEKERVSSGHRTRMVILHNFDPCVDDELKVTRGEEVSVLYQENDWLYVIAGDGREGFIPYTYCLPVQRSVDDFVTLSGNSQNSEPMIHARGGSSDTCSRQRPSSAHVSSSYGSNAQEVKPAYQFATIGKPPQPLLNRSSSKSLPDISNLANPSEAKRPVNGYERYPMDARNSQGHNDLTQTPSFEDEGIKDLTYGMSRDYAADLKTTMSRPRSLSYETQERKRAQYNKSRGGIHSQPTTPVRTNGNVRNVIGFGTNYLNNGQPVAGNHGNRYSSAGPTYSSSVRLSRRRDEEGDQDYVESLRRAAAQKEEEKRRPLHQSWGPSSGQALRQLLQNSLGGGGGQLNQSLQTTSNRQAAPSSPQTSSNQQNLLQIVKPRSSSDSTPQVASSFLTATNRNRTPLSSSSLFREESAKLNSSYQGATLGSPEQGQKALVMASRGSSSGSGLVNKARIEKFNKRAHGEYLAIYDFMAQQENDLAVERGEFVTVLNTEDADWYWIRRSDHKEGFVPSNYLLNINGQIQNSPDTIARAPSTAASGLQFSTTNPGSQYTTARQQPPNWSTTGSSNQQQPKPIQPVVSTNNNYHPFTTAPLANNKSQLANGVINHQGTSSIATTNQPTLLTSPNATYNYHHHHQPSSSVKNATQQEPSLNTGSNNHQTPTVTSSPREPRDPSYPRPQPQQQQQLSPIAALAPLSQLSSGIPIGATRLICLYEYQAQTPDDLTVSRGQWLYADASQDDPDWLWVYSPSQSKAGYIPRTYAKPPSSW